LENIHKIFEIEQLEGLIMSTLLAVERWKEESNVLPMVRISPRALFVHFQLPHFNAARNLKPPNAGVFRMHGMPGMPETSNF
jgi:hypothetical protein